MDAIGCGKRQWGANDKLGLSLDAHNLHALCTFQSCKTTSTWLGLVNHAINTQQLNDCIGFTNKELYLAHPSPLLCVSSFPTHHKLKCPQAVDFIINQLLK